VTLSLIFALNVIFLCYNRYMTVIYKGYATNLINNVVDLYKHSTGFEPTVILVKPKYKLFGEHPQIIYSQKYGASGMILASHLLTADEIGMVRTETLFQKDDRVFSKFISREEEIDCSSDTDADNEEMTSVVIKAKGKPIREKENLPTCPHCQQKIKTFENLGWWWGWEQGVMPPYWDQLRLYVFSRDGYKCQKCNALFKETQLECHHIVPKEEGGHDGARNLTTLCHGCHQDTKPLFE
jgi:5-methylcytosine-specific restriction endonuclease McrA